MTERGHRADLTGRRVAVLATDGFEQEELFEPLTALRDAGADARVISLPTADESIRGWNHGDWGRSVDVDGTVGDTSPEDFDALVLPGGVMNPDHLRRHETAIQFVRSFFDEGKPVAAICHAGWMLAEAEATRGRTLTSYPSIRTDMENAGANWVDEDVVVDAGLVTSRGPADMDAFVSKMLEEIEEDAHAARHV